jgi:hypothetical protein
MMLIEYLPGFYANVKEIKELMNAQHLDFDLLKIDLDDAVNQLHIDTATWGLSNWERVCGIKTDESKPYDQRRSVIKSKIRGLGTVTASMIKNVTDSYTNGDVEVTENPSLYTIAIKFTSKIGIPPNLEDAKGAIREIIPAHIGVDYLFKYLLVQDVETMTIDQIQATELSNFAPFADVLG